MMLAIHPQPWYNEGADEMTCRASGAQQRQPGALPVYSKRECNRTPSFFDQSNGKSPSSARPARRSPVKSTLSTNTSVAVRLFPSRSV